MPKSSLKARGAPNPGQTGGSQEPFAAELGGVGRDELDKKSYTCF